MNLEELDTWASPGIINVVVETPRGAATKLAYDPESAAFVLKRALAAGVVYPFEWGFIPRTRSAHGDPLDALVLGGISTWPGTVIRGRVIAMVRMTDVGDGGARLPNHRVLAMPDVIEGGRPRYLRDIPVRTRQEIERFLLSATWFTGKRARIVGWSPRVETRRYIQRCSFTAA